MTRIVEASAASRLRDRLRVAAQVLIGDSDEWSAHDAGTVLERLVQGLKVNPSTRGVWLLLTALCGAFPTVDLVLAARRALELKTTHEATEWLLTSALGPSRRHGHVDSTMVLATDQVVVDVDFSARHNMLTGIQRVVRETVPRLVDRYDVVPVVWSDGSGCFRRLSAAERVYLTAWPGHEAAPPASAPDPIELVVPWGTRVVLAEVPAPEHGDRLTALARFSGSKVGIIGYDCIPAVSGDLVPAVEREKFGRYLEVVKHSDRVAAISESSAREFQGFCRALSAQGLTGPTVSPVPLPNVTDVLHAHTSALDVDSPIVLCVGSLDPRKNQMTLLEAAEVLWKKGHDFTVILIGGGGGRPPELMKVISELQERGRKLTVRTSAPEEYLSSTYAAARFSVFPSLHEGFGLPIVESLSHGVPVITSKHGSMRELAEGQGGLLVDPTSVVQLADAIECLLTDDELLAQLQREAYGRRRHTWDDYATNLWDTLVESGETIA